MDRIAIELLAIIESEERIEAGLSHNGSEMWRRKYYILVLLSRWFPKRKAVYFLQFCEFCRFFSRQKGIFLDKFYRYLYF